MNDALFSVAFLFMPYTLSRMLIFKPANIIAGILDFMQEKTKQSKK
jgi:hypothetical protein